MSSVIKAALGGELHSLAWREPEAAPEAPAKDPAVVALEEEIAALREATDALTAAHERELEHARVEARDDAARAHVRNDADRLARLKDGLENAVTALAGELADLEKLALLIAETALANAFADVADVQTLVAAAIARQMKEVRRDSVLKVCVSAEDFQDEAALARLGESLRGVDVTASADVESGGARISLRLGEIELSLPGYWEKVKALLQGALGAPA